jgi:CRP-like cAMP-binding protein
MTANNILGLPEWSRYTHFFKRKEIGARTILLREGEVSKKAFYIEKGCIRLWFNNNGKDVTFQFFFEGQGVSSTESFRGNQPSSVNIESIEPCIIHVISKKDFQAILNSSTEIKKQIEEQTFLRLIFYQKLFLSRIKDNPQKRYEELIHENPKILQRIPQLYIASYLGITSVSLSRIRRRVQGIY